MDRLREISENTYISLALVIVLVGGVVWLTTLHNNVAAQEVATQKVVETNQVLMDRLGDIQNRLIRIEISLETKKR